MDPKVEPSDLILPLVKTENAGEAENSTNESCEKCSIDRPVDKADDQNGSAKNESEPTDVFKEDENLIKKDDDLTKKDEDLSKANEDLTKDENITAKAENEETRKNTEENSLPKEKNSGKKDNNRTDNEIGKEMVATKEEESKNKIHPQAVTTSKLINTANPKITAGNKTNILPTTEHKDGKRKRKILSDQRDESVDDVESKAKRVKIKNANDGYCWRCHKDSVDAQCSACPRSWHRKCMGGQPPASINENWICGECAAILRAENAATRSEVVAHMSIDHLCMLLKYIVERMRSCQGSEPFWKPVDLTEVPNYMDYVVKPMDLNLLETNVRAKLYGSTDAFMADAKWIQHNCIVFNTCGGVYADTSKLTNAAKQIIKTAKQEVAEIEACPDCYARGRNLPRPHHMWFIETCRRPHPLIWAKLKGFPFWPAKAMPRLNGQGYVDVRFFGQHDRAWVAPKDVFLYSRDPPAPMPRKRKLEMAECIKEVTRHCRKLEIAFGPFQFAPAKTPYNANDRAQIKLMLPQYDPSRANDRTPVPGNATRRKSPFRKRNSLLKKKIENEAASSRAEESSVVFESSINESSRVELPTKNPPIELSATESPKPRGDSTISPSEDDEKDEKSSAVAVAAERPVAESPRPRKRVRKSTNGSETKNSEEREEKMTRIWPIRVIETSSTGSTSDDSAIKVETSTTVAAATAVVGNGTPTGSVQDTPTTKPTGGQQAKRKSEKMAVTVEKSLAALLRKVTTTKGRISHPRNSSVKPPIASSTPTNGSTKIESKTPPVKVYKPKARMVDKVNAEKAFESSGESKERNEKSKDDNDETSKSIVEAKVINGILTPVLITPGPSSGNSSGTSGNVSLVHGKRDNNIIITNSLLKVPVKKAQPRILVLNNGTLESKQAPASAPAPASGSSHEEAKRRTATEPAPVRVKSEPNLSPQTFVPATQKKQSRAKKTFPNKAPRLPQLLPKLPKTSPASLDAMVYIPAQRNENESDYQLPPPEAGPLTAQLHRGTNELVKRMAQLVEFAIKETAATDSNSETGSNDTIDAHRATIHSLRLQIERMRWQHQQQLAELKHNTDRTLREMRASLEAERFRAIEEIRKEADEEKARCIEDVKSKQWCSQCGREALFYCCWNTAYCDHLCQQAHWQSHQWKCAQKPAASNVSGDSGNAQQQQQQKGNASTTGNSGTGTIGVTKSRTSFLKPSVITKHLKIP